MAENQQHSTDVQRQYMDFLNDANDDINTCKKLAMRKDIFDLLAKNFAPSFHGHELVKKAILCLLIGGVEKNLENGTRLRGDLNILLIGNSFIEMSQFIRYVDQTTQRITLLNGQRGVNLIDAVTNDDETMVLADRVVVCIEKFDEMTEDNMNDINEVMKNSWVSIAYTLLNVRLSVLAAANIVPDLQLSGFDLKFILPDTNENECSQNEQSGEEATEKLSIDFMTKYISVVKDIKPKLTDQAGDLICEEYARLRSFTGSNFTLVQPITPRAVETLIILATAHAKIRMSESIDPEDAKVASEIFQFAYFNEILEEKNNSKRESTNEIATTSTGVKRAKLNDFETNNKNKAVDVKPQQILGDITNSPPKASRNLSQ